MLHICMDASVNHIIHNHITLITLLGVHHAHHVSCQCTRCMLNWQPCSQDSPVFTSGITRTPLKLHACKLKIKNGKPREKMDGRRLHTFAESPAVSFIHSALNSSIPSAPSREAPPLPPSTTNFCCKNFHSQTIPSSFNQASSTDTCTNNAKFLIVVQDIPSKTCRRLDL